MMRSGRCNLNLLSAWLDGEVTAQQAAACERHLAVCASCRARLDELRQARTLLRDLPQVAVPSDLADRIKLAAAEELAQHQSGLLWPAWAAPLAVAAALLIALTVVQMVRPSRLEHTGQVAVVPPVATVDQPVQSAEVAPAAPVAALELRAQPVAKMAGPQAPAAVRRVHSHSSSRSSGRALARTEPVSPAPATRAAAYALAVDTAPEPTLNAVPAAPKAAVTEGAAELALAPRLTPAYRELAPPRPAPTPSALELELASGVVAAMLVQDFIEEHLIESTSTLLAVATGTPSTELGPRLVEGEDDAHFDLRFTESMRRALSADGQ